MSIFPGVGNYEFEALCARLCSFRSEHYVKGQEAVGVQYFIGNPAVRLGTYREAVLAGGVEASRIQIGGRGVKRWTERRAVDGDGDKELDDSQDVVKSLKLCHIASHECMCSKIDEMRGVDERI